MYHTTVSRHIDSRHSPNPTYSSIWEDLQLSTALKPHVHRLGIDGGYVANPSTRIALSDRVDGPICPDAISWPIPLGLPVQAVRVDEDLYAKEHGHRSLVEICGRL